MAQPKKGLNAKLNQLKLQFSQAYAKGQYSQAKHFALTAHRLVPKHPKPLSDLAVCSIYLGDWKSAISYAEQCLQYEPENLASLDAISHAWSAQHQFEHAAPYGKKALLIRDASIANNNDAPEIAPVPKTGKRILSFSLFGDNPKYCETACLNAQLQPKIYPDWTCRFYLDDTVPVDVQKRLALYGAEVITIKGEASTWYGTFWRFLALEDDDIERVVFRDADSLISHYEAAAVEDWIQSQQPFHIMRDWGSHTELILAGLWGATGNSVKNISQLIARFLERYSKSTHFADQFFLRECIWPLAKHQCLHHDSIFNFPNSKPYPIKRTDKEVHLGSNIVSGYFECTVNKADDQEITWALVDQQEHIYCQYNQKAKDNKIKVSLPLPLLEKMQAKELTVKIL